MKAVDRKLEGRPVLLLPGIDDSAVPAWRLTRHAVSLVLGILGLMVVAAVATSLVARVSVTVDGDGFLEPVSVWSVRPMDAGVLSDVLVKTGDTVVAGQAVARLDTADAALAVINIQSQLASARVDLARTIAQVPIDHARFEAGVAEATARTAAARTKLQERMVDVGVEGDVDSVAQAATGRVHIILDAASADLKGAIAAGAGARAQLAATDLAPFDIQRKRDDIHGLETQLTAARRRLARHTIVAPAGGILLTEQPERLVGSLVPAGEPFLEIGDLKAWHASVAVPEHDVHRIRIGDRASVEIPALSAMPNDRLAGKVLSIGWQPATSGMTTSALLPAATAPGGYRVVIAVDSDEVATVGMGILRRGYAVHGKVITRSGKIFGLLEGYAKDRTRALTR